MDPNLEFDSFLNELNDLNKPSFKDLPSEVKFVMFQFLPVCKIIQIQMLNKDSFEMQTTNQTF